MVRKTIDLGQIRSHRLVAFTVHGMTMLSCLVIPQRSILSQEKPWSHFSINLQSKDLLLFSVLYNWKLNIFKFWAVGRTQQGIWGHHLFTFVLFCFFQFYEIFETKWKINYVFVYICTATIQFHCSNKLSVLTRAVKMGQKLYLNIPLKKNPANIIF